MQSGLVAFDRASAARIAAAVRFVEGIPPGIPGTVNSVPFDSIFPAKIVSANSGQYGWEEMIRREDGTWEALAGGRTSADLALAREDNSLEVAVDTIVRLHQRWDGAAEVWTFGFSYGSGVTVKVGKATATWIPASGNSVTLDPCDMSGTDNGETNITCYIVMPTGATPKGVQIAANDIIAYTVLPNGSGLLLPVVQSKVEHQYDTGSHSLQWRYLGDTSWTTIRDFTAYTVGTDLTLASGELRLSRIQVFSPETDTATTVHVDTTEC